MAKKRSIYTITPGNIKAIISLTKTGREIGEVKLYKEAILYSSREIPDYITEEAWIKIAEYRAKNFDKITWTGRQNRRFGSVKKKKR